MRGAGAVDLLDASRSIGASACGVPNTILKNTWRSLTCGLLLNGLTDEKLKSSGAQILEPFASRGIVMTKIGLHGAAGHMGTTLIRAISESAICTLAGGCERPDSPSIGKDLGSLAGLPPTGLHITADAAALCDASDVIVDYSAASATMSLLPVVIERRTPVLICTTGFSTSQHAALVDAGRSVPVLVGANMSASVIAMYELVRTAARLLNDEFDIEIFDFHPWDKIDSRPARRWNWPSMPPRDVASTCPTSL